MRHLLKPFIKLFMLFVAFSIAANVFGGLVHLVEHLGLLIAAICVFAGAAGAIKHGEQQGMLHGFLVGFMWLPALIWRAIVAIVSFVFRFIGGLA